MLFKLYKMKKFNNFYTDINSFFILKKNINKVRMEKIFSKIRVGTTFKTTSYDRMADVNKKLKNYIKKIFQKRLWCVILEFHLVNQH